MYVLLFAQRVAFVEIEASPPYILMPLMCMHIAVPGLFGLQSKCEPITVFERMAYRKIFEEFDKDKGGSVR